MTHADSGPRLKVLGVTQDGGMPQPGCNCSNCSRARSDARERRLPASLALLAGGGSQAWHLFEATPQLPLQLEQIMHGVPAKPLMESVFLTHAHIGHYTGLMHLGREVMGAVNVPVYAGNGMATVLRTHAPWSQLVELGNIEVRPLQSGKPVSLSAELTVTPLAVNHRNEFSETFGFVIRGPRASALFIPDIDRWSDNEFEIGQLVSSVDYCFLDATFFSADELPGRNMKEIPHPPVRQTMDLLQHVADREATKIFFIHLNHSNPLLDRQSEAYREVVARGFNVAEELMDIPL